MIDILVHFVFRMFIVIGFVSSLYILIMGVIKGKSFWFTLIVSTIPFSLGAHAFIWYGVYLGWW